MQVFSAIQKKADDAILDNFRKIPHNTSRIDGEGENAGVQPQPAVYTTMKKHISMAVIRRMPRYYRFLRQLEAQGVARISSKNLAQRMNVNPSQIRQDLSCFGDFGQQGYGYTVSQLKESTAGILGLSNSYKTILIGAGNLGKTLLSHLSFEQFGFRIIGVFDRAPAVVGTKFLEFEILGIDSLGEFCFSEKPEMAILCLPEQAAGEVVSLLHESGVKNYWNFSHHDIALEYDDVIVENVHLNDSLMTLCYRITHADDEAEQE